LAEHPLLILRGVDSDLLSAAALQRMVTVAPDVTAVTIAGVGHAPDLDEPEAVAALDAFLSRWST
jgi:pimeloyl-ACP methyl ester carboxylesterase